MTKDAEQLAVIRDAFLNGRDLEAVQLLADYLDGVKRTDDATLARCPGCGDRGDVSHVVACVTIRIERHKSFANSATTHAWKAGARFALEVMERQIARRGGVDLEAVRAAIAQGPQ